MSKKSYTDRDHPFKTSACLRGGGGGGPHFAGMSMVADGRGVGVSTCAKGQKVTVQKNQKSPS